MPASAPATFVRKLTRTGIMITIMALTSLLLSACATGGLGDILGGGQDEGTRYAQEIDATVENVDPRSSAILVTVDRRAEVAAGQRVNLYYDDRTSVTYEGNSYRPDALERGDRIRAQVVDDGRSLQVQSILVTQDSSPDNGGVIGDTVISGTVRDIDTRDSTLTIDTYGSSADAVVRYDTRTRVLLGDRRLDVDELRVGDDVDVELDADARIDLADTITVIDDRSSDPVTNSVRGEVVTVDERRGELVISTRDSLISGFDVSSDDTVIFRFDRDVPVEYQGQIYTPENLERGDGVLVEYDRRRDELWAERIRVTSNVRDR